jgi:hypothetical protein
VHDFLFRYYRYSPGKLEEWHPGVATALRDSPQARERFTPPRYVRRRGRIVQDAGVLRPGERRRLQWTRDLLEATARRLPNLGCFGMHEWAMVYHGRNVRHRETVPLRLSQKEVDTLVETRSLVCSHYDAFRFFSPEARPMNHVIPTLSGRQDLECYRSMPWIGTALLWESFELALRLRVLDMRASPYDLSSLGYEPVPVETADGRRLYRREQAALSEEAGRLRGRLVDGLRKILALAEGPRRPSASSGETTPGSR